MHVCRNKQYIHLHVYVYMHSRIHIHVKVCKRGTEKVHKHNDTLCTKIFDCYQGCPNAKSIV